MESTFIQQIRLYSLQSANTSAKQALADAEIALAHLQKVDKPVNVELQEIYTQVKLNVEQLVQVAQQAVLSITKAVNLTHTLLTVSFANTNVSNPSLAPNSRQLLQNNNNNLTKLNNNNKTKKYSTLVNTQNNKRKIKNNNNNNNKKNTIRFNKYLLDYQNFEFDAINRNLTLAFEYLDTNNITELQQTETVKNDYFKKGLYLSSILARKETDKCLISTEPMQCYRYWGNVEEEQLKKLKISNSINYINYNRLISTMFYYNLILKKVYGKKDKISIINIPIGTPFFFLYGKYDEVEVLLPPGTLTKISDRLPFIGIFNYNVRPTLLKDIITLEAQIKP